MDPPPGRVLLFKKWFVHVATPVEECSPSELHALSVHGQRGASHTKSAFYQPSCCEWLSSFPFSHRFSWVSVVLCQTMERQSSSFRTQRVLKRWVSRFLFRRAQRRPIPTCKRDPSIVCMIHARNGTDLFASWEIQKSSWLQSLSSIRVSDGRMISHNWPPRHFASSVSSLHADLPSLRKKNMVF